MSEDRAARLQLTRPLLTAWREPGVLHLGFDERSFLLRDVPEQLQRAVQLLAEPRTVAELAARLPDLEPGWLDWLCEHLSTAGLLTRRVTSAQAPILVCGGGQLAAAVSSMLRAVGLRPRQLAADPDILSPGALVVVAAETAEPDRAVLNRLAGAGIEHLVVRADHSRAVVGPFVDPAAGPCVRCDDLARTHFDRSWPVLLAQLCRTEVSPDAGLASWAAATAAAQLRARLAGQPSELVGRTLELGVDEFRLRSRCWPVQPDCGCHGDVFPWSGTLAG